MAGWGKAADEREEKRQAQHRFACWMEAVDREVEHRSGVSVYDLADQPFRDWYEDDINAAEAAGMALEEERG